MQYSPRLRLPRLLLLAALAAASSSGCHTSNRPRIGATASYAVDAAGRIGVRFDVTWPDAYRTEDTWNALWLFVKYRDAGGGWRHARVSTAWGDHQVDEDRGVPAEIRPADDGMGVFVARADRGRGPVDWSGVRVALESPGVPEGSRPRVRVYALEMVHVPAGPFYLGDGDVGQVAGHFQRAVTGGPFLLADEDSLVLGGSREGSLANSDGYGMRGADDDPHTPARVPDDFGDSTAVDLPAAFPKGHAGFYVMRHELTQGEYARFLNALTPAQRGTRDATRDPDGRVRPSVDGYTITARPPYTASVPDRPAHFVSWLDLAAFADWSGLRPMTELEFEKAAGGSVLPEPGEFAWGTREISRERYRLTQPGTPAERVAHLAVDRGNAAYQGTMGVASPSCWSCIRQPIPASSFQSAGASRTVTGQSVFGIGELSGNLFEIVVTVGHPGGRRFAGTHGDGALDAGGAAAGTEVSTWPGAVPSQGSHRVIGADGTGLRGGSWASSEARLRVSDRALASTPAATRLPTTGIRLARTAHDR